MHPSKLRTAHQKEGIMVSINFKKQIYTNHMYILNFCFKEKAIYGSKGKCQNTNIGISFNLNIILK